jgi:hypothetical protein
MYPLKYSYQIIKKMWHKVEGKQILHFLHIGKTGGSAIKFALGGDRIIDNYAIFLHPHRFKLRDIPNGEGFFFFLRDPISRFVSGFHSRQRQGQPRLFKKWTFQEKEAFEYFKTPNDLALALSSLNKEENTKAQNAMQNIGHIRTHYWLWFENEAYFKSRNSDLFFVGFQESLDKDFDDLKVLLNLPESVKLPEDELHAHRNPARLDKHLDSQSIENLRRWYAEDYKFIELCREIKEKMDKDKGR